jgi:hypothetical protein
MLSALLDHPCSYLISSDLVWSCLEQKEVECIVNIYIHIYSLWIYIHISIDILLTHSPTPTLLGLTPTSPLQLCLALYYNQHVASTINQLYIAKVSFVSSRGLGIIARWPPGPLRGLLTPLRPSTWFLYLLATSMLLMATRPSTWFRDSSAATPPRPPLRVVPLLVDKVVGDIY